MSSLQQRAQATRSGGVGPWCMASSGLEGSFWQQHSQVFVQGRFFEKYVGLLEPWQVTVGGSSGVRVWRIPSERVRTEYRRKEIEMVRNALIKGGLPCLRGPTSPPNVCLTISGSSEGHPNWS